MKVYCLFHEYPYEGNDLLGVYSTQEKADEAKETYLQKRSFIEPNFLFIDEWTIDEEPK